VSRPLPPALSTFAVGSLPHTQLELALQVGLSLDVPTLPQLPRAHASEYMLPQALEGLPGLVVGPEGRAQVDPAAWSAGAPAFLARLDAALASGQVAAFEPTALTTRAWRPFLWEVEQRRARFAKAQLAGPVTAVWATTLTDGSPLEAHPAIASAAVRLVVARALAMTRALAATGATPVLCFDEPGLYAFDKRRPSHVVELGELRIALEAARRAGALTMVHCCGNTDWTSVFGLPVDLVSADVRLSLAAQVASGPALEGFLARGGRLALGIVPTNATERAPVEELVDDALASLDDLRAKVLSGALIGPACGLALRNVVESEAVFEDVRAAARLLQETARES
jgi:hypothetical protein